MANNPCPTPSNVDKCPAIQTYSVGGTEYIALQLCDKADGTMILAVYQLCSGEISGTPTYYDLEGSEYTPVGVIGQCNSSGVDYEILCDKGTDPDTQMIAMWDDSTSPPSLKYYTPAVDGSLTAYTPIGPITACGSAGINETQNCYVATADGPIGSGYSAGDILHQVLFWDSSSTPPALLGIVWRNQSTNQILTTAPIFTDLTPCDGVPPRDCIPSSDVNVRRSDCIGGPVPPAVLRDLSPLSINSDDADFDGVCDDSVSIAPETYPAPFPVNEPARAAVSGLTLFNGATLTASPAGGNIDSLGAGWLRLTNNDFAQRGGAIVSTPFPSTIGIEFEYTYATYTPRGIGGADGHSFMLLDGNQPVPVQMGGAGGALGYASNNNQPGILGGVISIGLDEFGNFSNPGAGITGTGPGFRPQHLVIRGGGNGGTAFSAPNQYPFLAAVDLQAVAGQTIDGHNRAAAVKVRGTLIPVGGQMTLNLSMDFGAGFVPVIGNLLINQALPTNLRMGFSSSTGGGTNFHEIRDILASPPSRRHWRAITPVFDEPPACATSLIGTAEITYTIVSDTQTLQGGDNDNEHFVGWALEDPVGTYTWLSQRWIRSAPTDVGVERKITLDTGNLTVAQRSQLRLVLGAETVDLRGSYGIRYDLVTTNLTAIGCPAETIKTMPISAPCPIAVTIVGDADGNTAISATVNTVDVQIVCSDLGQIFRREINDTSGTPKITFLGQDGAQVSPSTWTAGPCKECDCQKLIQPACATDSATGDSRQIAIIYSFSSNGTINVAATQMVDSTGATVTLTPTETLTLGNCTGDQLQIMPICFVLHATPTVIHTAYKVVSITGTTTTTLYYYESDTGTIHPIGDVSEVECIKEYDPVVLCDDIGPFLRHYRYGSYGSLAGVVDTLLDGSSPYTVVGTVKTCVADDLEVITLCDDNQSFLRLIVRSTDGTVTIINTELDAVTPYTPVGIVHLCCREEIGITCYFSSGTGANCENDLDRVLWNNSPAWQNGNPTETQIETALSSANTPVTTENTQLLGIQTTVETSGAGLGNVTYGSAQEALRITVSPGGTASITYTFDRQVCIRVSTRVDDNLPLTLTGDGPIHAYHSTSDPTIQGPAPTVTGDNTTTVTVTSPSGGGGSRILFEMSGTTFTQSYTSSAGSTSSAFSGLSLGLPTGAESATYQVIEYSDGTRRIVNLNDPTDRPTEIDPTWSIVPCVDQRVDVEAQRFCDDNGAFLRWYIYNEDGTRLRTRDTDLVGVSYTTIGTVVTSCSNDKPPDTEIVTLCDDNGSFLRAFITAGDGTITVEDFDLSGTAYIVVGTVQSCIQTGLKRVIPRYQVLNGADTWTLGTDSAGVTQAVTVMVIRVADEAILPTVTDDVGTHPLFSGQSVSWSIELSENRLGLDPTLIVTSNAGDIIAIAWTEEI